MFHKVLVPLDGSRAAEAALEQATYLASRTGGNLLLVQVLSNYMVTDNPPLTPDFREQLDLRDRGEARKYLGGVELRVQGQGLLCQSEVIESGNPAEGILDCAESRSVDLIVLTSHGRSGLSRFLLGSVAERVLRHAVCPVLVVRRNP